MDKNLQERQTLQRPPRDALARVSEQRLMTERGWTGISTESRDRTGWLIAAALAALIGWSFAGPLVGVALLVLLIVIGVVARRRSSRGRGGRARR